MKRARLPTQHHPNKIYGDINVNGRSNIHLGDNYYYTDPDKVQKCLQTFKTSPYASYKDGPNPRRLPDTCLWAFNHPHFRRWRHDDGHNVLWISADPGCGKSVLSRSLVDDLREERQASVCYFFFKDNSEQNDLGTALCAMLHQLFCDQPSLVDCAMPAWIANGDQITQEIPELWQLLLKVASSSERQVICIFDALDECGEHHRRRLIDLVCCLKAVPHSKPNRPVKFLMTSRPYDNVERWFNHTEMESSEIRLRGEDRNDQIGQEINLVIRQQVRKLGAEFQLSQDVQRKLQTSLEAMQNRTYLWLHLTIDTVRNEYRRNLQSSKVRVEELILPRSVEEAYDQILQKTEYALRTIVKRVLLTIVGARRPLSTLELYIVLGLADSKRGAVPDLTDFNKDRFEAQIRDWCGLFIFVNHSRVFLIHQTAKDFLLRRGPFLGPSPCEWKSCLSIDEANNQMARVCVDFLLAEGTPARFARLISRRFPNHILGRASVPVLDSGVDDFLNYCSDYWAAHVEDCRITHDDTLCQRVYTLCTENETMLLAWSNQPLSWSRRRAFPFTYPAQHVLSVMGYVKVLRCFDKGGDVDWNQRCKATGETALHCAVKSNVIASVRCLFELGADIKARTGPCWGMLREEPLRHFGDSILSSMMFNTNLDQDTESKPVLEGGKTALQIAYGREMIECLLECEAYADAETTYKANLSTKPRRQSF